jgi:hypothetical protein
MSTGTFVPPHFTTPRLGVGIAGQTGSTIDTPLTQSEATPKISAEKRVPDLPIRRPSKDPPRAGAGLGCSGAFMAVDLLVETS